MASPETSVIYLERCSFKMLMEWLTARCILHRPDDPMTFCRDLLHQHVVKQKDGADVAYDSTLASRLLKVDVAYDSTLASRLLKECYDDAMNSADEHGIIHPEACKPIFDIDIGNTTTITSTNGTASVASSIPKDAEQTVSAPGNGTALITSCSPARNSSSAAAVAEGTASATTVGDESSGDAEGEAVGKQMGSNLLSASIELLEIARPEIAASTVVAGVCKAVKARRGTLFKVIDDDGTLREMGAGTMSRQRTVQPGQGLVGSIATRADGAACIVPQPSNEPAFCAEVDLPPASGTDKGSGNSSAPQLMYGPVSDGAGGIWGVLVVAEFVGGNTFDEETLQTFRSMCDIAAVSMRNAEKFGEGERGSEKFRNMVEVIEATNDHFGVNHLLYTIAKCLPLICDAQKCTCFLVDEEKDQLWVVQGEVNMRVPRSKGIVGAVATSGNAENIQDVYADPRFNKEVDVATGFQTHSILAMPVRGGDNNKVIAVLQLINKQPGDSADSAGTVAASCASAAGMHFTAQDVAVIGAFLSLLGPHIFTSSIAQFHRKINIKQVHKMGDDEEEAFPGNPGRQKSTGSVRNLIDPGQSLEEEEEDDDDDVDTAGSSLASFDEALQANPGSSGQER